MYLKYMVEFGPFCIHSAAARHSATTVTSSDYAKSRLHNQANGSNHKESHSKREELRQSGSTDTDRHKYAKYCRRAMRIYIFL